MLSACPSVGAGVAWSMGGDACVARVLFATANLPSGDASVPSLPLYRGRFFWRSASQADGEHPTHLRCLGFSSGLTENPSKKPTSVNSLPPLQVVFDPY